MNHRLLSDTHTQRSDCSFTNQAWLYANKNPNAPSRSIPDELKGYVFRTTGGNDKHKQGVLLPYRVCLLADKHSPDGKQRLRLVPKRTTNMLNLSKEDGVCKYVIRWEVKSGKKEDAKPYARALKIQCLVTPIRLQRRRHLRSFKRRKLEH
ncbi:uncharacterized protein ARMOST_12529 [Armillaria ostoyae]|uniref:Uncharacterized protein n=1 Tax=Armillaria ostoyae TaxID=47428 RepID=A0A284RK69_ARMOS|nr:uncharacterized protein ARMOST_12529 [Armillaria ostoyae]